MAAEKSPGSPDCPEILDELASFLTEHKQALFDRVLRQRTRHLTVVLEDIFQSHNGSACLRSCECFGIQDVHIIENKNRYRVNRDITLGSSQWMTLRRYRDGDFNTPACLEALRNDGYRIVATTPQAGSRPLQEYDPTVKTALLFGNEKVGLSDYAIDHADDYLHIPMVGFTPSLNISVSVALCLFTLTASLRQSAVDWRLSEEEQEQLKTEWIRDSVRKRFPQLEPELHKRMDSKHIPSSR